MQTANVISALVQVLRQTKNNPLGIFDLTINLVTGLYKTKTITVDTSRCMYIGVSGASCRNNKPLTLTAAF